MSEPNPAWVAYAVKEIQANRDAEIHFEHLFKHYEPRCRGLLRKLGPQGDVEDLVQDSMLRVYRGIGAFRSDSSFNTWLMHIVKNVARNGIRDRNTKKAQATRASLDAMLEEDSDGNRGMPEPASPNPDPQEATLNTERRAKLAEALDALPARTRQCFLYYYFHGLSLKEIALLQRVSVNTVKKQLVEGRKKLRPLLGLVMNLFNILLALMLFA